MVIIGRSQIAGGGGTAKRLEFEYTGTYNERLDDGVVELLSTGTLKVTKDTYIDAFLVGGGGAGNGSSNGFNSTWTGGGGGAGGFTKTITKALLQANVEYSVVIGAGGIALSGKNAYGKVGPAGGNTTAFGYTAGGGKSASAAVNGGNGGSGGGVGAGKNTTSGVNPGDGASDGNDALTINSRVGGTGQGTTTREFGEATGKLYAGGGAGGAGSSTTVYASGGEGGGAKQQTSAAANTGGGGGGSGSAQVVAGDYVSYPGSGGSGIVCIRLHKE